MVTEAERAGGATPRRRAVPPARRLARPWQRSTPPDRQGIALLPDGPERPGSPLRHDLGRARESARRERCWKPGIGAIVPPRGREQACAGAGEPVDFSLRIFSDDGAWQVRGIGQVHSAEISLRHSDKLFCLHRRGGTPHRRRLPRADAMGGARLRRRSLREAAVHRGRIDRALRNRYHYELPPFRLQESISGTADSWTKTSQPSGHGQGTSAVCSRACCCRQRRIPARL